MPRSRQRNRGMHAPHENKQLETLALTMTPTGAQNVHTTARLVSCNAVS